MLLLKLAKIPLISSNDNIETRKIGNEIQNLEPSSSAFSGNQILFSNPFLERKSKDSEGVIQLVKCWKRIPRQEKVTHRVLWKQNPEKMKNAYTESRSGFCFQKLRWSLKLNFKTFKIKHNGNNFLYVFIHKKIFSFGHLQRIL